MIECSKNGYLAPDSLTDKINSQTKLKIQGVVSQMKSSKNQASYSDDDQDQEGIIYSDQDSNYESDFIGEAFANDPENGPESKAELHSKIKSIASSKDSDKK